jgi:signal transduction histidine kinase
MDFLGEQLLHHTDEIVERWYEAWQRSPHAHPEIGEAALKDKLPLQLRVIGEQVRELAHAEHPEEMWKISERLDPELRVDQEIPIEEIVQEYRIVVSAIRAWMEERGIEVPFAEYSYFYEAIFELSAEAVRRYARYNADAIAKDRSAYLARLAHQLRNPLATMGMATSMLEDPRRRSDPNLVARMRSSVARMSMLVNGVMRLERFKAEELPVHPVPVRLADLVDPVIADNDAFAARKHLRVEVHLDRTLEMTLDPDLFIDAFGNLLQNAIKYTASGFVRIEIEPRADDVLFRIIDSGPGIPAERRAALFSPVQPGAGGGVGVGLTIAKRAVVAQQGTIGCTCEPGHGSTFWFQLPRIVQAREERPPPP